MHSPARPIKGIRDSPFLVSARTTNSPFTVTFLSCAPFSMNDATKRSMSARVLTRLAQKPWNVSAFSVHVCSRTSSPDLAGPEGTSTEMFCRRARTVSRCPVWIR